MAVNLNLSAIPTLPRQQKPATRHFRRKEKHSNADLRKRKSLPFSPIVSLEKRRFTLLARNATIAFMKRLLLMSLAAISVTFAGDPNVVIIDTFGNPRTEVRFISSSQVQIGRKVIPWNKLNAELQFKLTPTRQKVLVIEADEKRKAEQEAEIRKSAELRGIVPISGRVINVTKTGCIVYTDSGMLIFLRGLRGPADGERINAKLIKTEETFSYTTVLGASKTLRIYDVAQ